MIKAAVFDVDGVLINSFEANLKFFHDLLNWAGYPFPSREEYQKIYNVSMMDVIKLYAKSATEEKINQIWQIGCDKEEVKYDDSLLSMPESAREVIDQLSNKYALAIVTSRVREAVYPSPEFARFKKYFKVEISYQDTEKHKPDPEPLLLVAQKLNVAPAECVYIGDAESDLLAARTAGMKFVFYPDNHSGQADAATSSFVKLPELIMKL